MTPEESDRHKAMKDFLTRTGQSAGLEVQVETTTKNRTSRPDVTITGAGGVSLGCEAQYYNASAGTVLRRSKAHAEAGLTANWITHDDRFHLIDRSNWMLTREMTWKEISHAADIALMGGFRVLAEWRCTASAERPCPDARVKTGCGNRHRLPLAVARRRTGVRRALLVAAGVVREQFGPWPAQRRRIPGTPTSSPGYSPTTTHHEVDEEPLLELVTTAEFECPVLHKVLPDPTTNEASRRGPWGG